MDFRERQPGIFYPRDDFVAVGPDELRRLVESAGQQPRKRARICAHQNIADPLHDMIVCHRLGAYVRPHRHVRPQSLHVVSGRCDLLLFGDDGELRDLLALSPPDEDGTLFVRLSSPQYYSLMMRTDPLIIHEAMTGPFTPGEQIYAEWSPVEEDPVRGLQFLEQHVENWRKRQMR
ncbi:MAG: WbuC family cupin fold metalloprotein [Planctomycetaceae bacterium]